MRRRSVSAPLARFTALRGPASVTGDSGSGQGAPPCHRIRAVDRRARPNLLTASRLHNLATAVASILLQPIATRKALLALIVSSVVSRSERPIPTVSTYEPPQGGER